MEEYTVITQGNAIYLEGKLGDEEQLDEVDRGMLVSNQISGFLPLSVQWVNGNCRLLYNITGLTPLEQAARILENETRLTNFFLSLCKAEKECDEYLLNPRKIDLEPELSIWMRTERHLCCTVRSRQQDRSMTRWS